MITKFLAIARISNQRFENATKLSTQFSAQDGSNGYVTPAILRKILDGAAQREHDVKSIDNARNTLQKVKEEEDHYLTTFNYPHGTGDGEQV